MFNNNAVAHGVMAIPYNIVEVPEAAESQAAIHKQRHQPPITTVGAFMSKYNRPKYQ